MHKKRVHLKNKIDTILETLQKGGLLLIADDGKRENEVDLVFHASHANAANVNFTISHAKGLLCVSIAHDRADELGFYTSPRFPGGCAHTNFTLSVDAKSGITSGISAQDRAHTIAKMADPKITFSDFTTPGHVFPVRAVNGGLLQRAGHTEAVADLCSLAGMTQAAVMCEVLAESGEPLTPNKILENEHFSHIPLVTTAEILWYRLFFQKQEDCKFEEKSNLSFVLNPGHQSHFTLPTAIKLYSPYFSAEKLRISMTDSFSQWDNGVSKDDACAEITLFSHDNLFEPLPEDISDYCDLSAKEGVQGTKTSVRRILSLTRAFEFIEEKYETDIFSKKIETIVFPVKKDFDFFSV
jgi:3,4-dihydroxy-2-butanone 4-phosphate synthase